MMKYLGCKHTERKTNQSLTGARENEGPSPWSKNTHASRNKIELGNQHPTQNRENPIVRRAYFLRQMTATYPNSIRVNVFESLERKTTKKKKEKQNLNEGKIDIISSTGRMHTSKKLPSQKSLERLRQQKLRYQTTNKNRPKSKERRKNKRWKDHKKVCIGAWKPYKPNNAFLVWQIQQITRKTNKIRLNKNKFKNTKRKHP